jgi:hypothetical protein
MPVVLLYPIVTCQGCVNAIGSGTHFNQRALGRLSRGELLCQAFEVYQQLMPSHGNSFEHAVFLVTALAEGAELTVVRCAECGVLRVVNRLDREGEYCTGAVQGVAEILNLL